MLLKGRYLERPTLIPTPDGLVLEGMAHRGDRSPGLLILPPLPTEGGSMDHVVVAEIAYAVSRLGFSTLRLNYRAVGGSHRGKAAPAPADFLTDARAALDTAAANAQGTAPAVAALHGSDAIALRLAAEGQVCGVALISPTGFKLPDAVQLADRLPVCVVVGELDRDPGWNSSRPDNPGLMVAVVPGATRTYQRGLPEVGRAVGELVQRCPARFVKTP